VGHKKRLLLILVSILISLVISSCTSSGINERETTSITGQTQNTNTDSASTDEQNGKSAPDYELVFPDNAVNEIVISITPENYTAMMADMSERYGEFGSGENHNPADDLAAGGGNKPPFTAPADDDQNKIIPNEDEQQSLQQDKAIRQKDRNAAPGGRMMLMDSKENPIWVEATIDFNGETWEHIGIRYKGNSSLKSSWSSGNHKLPFKLDFDQFEDEYPETEDQRFYGFKQLSFASNFSDPSYLRELVAADIFRDAGVPAAQTAFYAVYIDSGDGAAYYGLYTAVEVVDDTVIETQFNDDSGNVYKPSGTAATFAEGTFNTQSMDLETNLEDANYSDVEALYSIINADYRISDPVQWRADLEAVFDVDTFLRWLATNTIIQNWDTYGSMSHNFYLYHDPESDQLVWIPWDNNEALRNARGRNAAVELDLSNVGENWALIRTIMDDETYKTRYDAYLTEIVLEVFNPERMETIYTDLHALIIPYVKKEQAEFTTLSDLTLFESSVETLMQHTRERYEAAIGYLQTLD